jgi:hypothetical protein
MATTATFAHYVPQNTYLSADGALTTHPAPLRGAGGRLLTGPTRLRLKEKPKMDIVSMASLDYFMTGGKEICYEEKGPRRKETAD